MCPCESFEIESISTKWIQCSNADQRFINTDRNIVIYSNVQIDHPLSLCSILGTNQHTSY